MLPPLRFTPLFQPYLWGGRRLADWFSGAPAAGPIAEAWLVSDEAKFPSRVADGPFAGLTLAELMRQFGSRLVGEAGGRFPILLKLLDARDHLSVQVHPNDQQARRVGPDQRGKTEAWVILDAEPGARLFAGLREGVNEATLRNLIAEHRMPEALHSFEPAPGDCIFLPAGTVHAIGAGLLLFEVQQTSDITYRLHDWDRVDPRTGQSRPLHIEEGLACIDFGRGPVGPATAKLDHGRELLVECEYFRLWRRKGAEEFAVGAAGECRVVIGVAGGGSLHAGGVDVPLQPGAAWLLPAETGPVRCRPQGPITVLECGLSGPGS